MTEREIINYIPIPIYGIEYIPKFGLQTVKIIYLNKTSIQKIGYSKSEIINLGYSLFKAIIHPDDLYKIANAMNAILHSDQTEQVEYCRTKKKHSDNYRYIKSNFKIISAKDKNKPVQFIVTAMEATAFEIQQHQSLIEKGMLVSEKPFLN